MENIDKLKRQLRSLWRELRHSYGTFYWRLRGYDEDGGVGVRVPSRPKLPIRPASAARRLLKPRHQREL